MATVSTGRSLLSLTLVVALHTTAHGQAVAPGAPAGTLLLQAAPGTLAGYRL